MEEGPSSKEDPRGFLTIDEFKFATCAMASPRVAEDGSMSQRPDAPDWLNCDLDACHVFQDVSAQIVATCRAFGLQLQGVCGQAAERLPPTAEKGANCDINVFDCTESCLSFLTSFGLLSNALLAVGEDLERAVTQPLQKTIATLEEESTGRLKHWHQVRARFAELQERYGRSRQRSLEARGRLASTAAENGRGWGWSKSLDGKAAMEQHAAICDLARCEEELLQSEASLRRLEDESRERLQELERENQVFLRGALTKGASSLRRLLPVADKAPAPEDGDDKAQAQESWSSVLPPSAPSPPCTRLLNKDEVTAPLPTPAPPGSLTSLESGSAVVVADAVREEEVGSKCRQSDEDAAKKRSVCQVLAQLQNWRCRRVLRDR